MRLSVNFVQRPKHTMGLALGLWLAAVVLSIASVYLGIRLVNNREEIPMLARRLDELQQQQQRIKAPGLPQRTELTYVRDRVKQLNSVSDQRGWNTSRLLTRLEEILPTDVQLRSFHHKAHDGEVLLVVESQNSSSLTSLLSNLEHESAFSEVLLNRQVSHVESGTSATEFDIKLSLKP